MAGPGPDFGRASEPGPHWLGLVTPVGFRWAWLALVLSCSVLVRPWPCRTSALNDLVVSWLRPKVGLPCLSLTWLALDLIGPARSRSLTGLTVVSSFLAVAGLALVGLSWQGPDPGSC